MLNLAGNDPIKEKNYLYLSVLNFFRFYQEYLFDFDRKKEEMEKAKK